MKIYRSKYFNTSDPKIWGKNIFKIGDGSFFIAKAVVTGLEIHAKKINFGPITLRQYNHKKDKNLRIWGGRRCVIELKFQDIKTRMVQKSPVSKFVEPFWLMYSVFLALQIYVDSWVGMLTIYYFDSKGKFIEPFGGERTTVADSRSIMNEPIINRLNKKLLLKYMNAQYSKLELAIDRYCKACFEIVDESIIDFVIVLENLLGIGLGNEISHRISLRGAFLLTSNSNTRKDYYLVFKYLYDQRSKMVHGEIDEINSPNSNSDKGKRIKEAFINLGASLSNEWWEDRYEISNIARKLVRKILLYFINHEDRWNSVFFENLELGIQKP